MSRRCDREGVEWPRLDAWDARPLRWEPGALDVLWTLAEQRIVLGHARAHSEVLHHLRERPPLPTERCACGDEMHPGHPRQACCGRCPWCCFCDRMVTS